MTQKQRNRTRRPPRGDRAASPVDVDALHERAMGHVRSARFDAAERDCRRALVARPDHAPSLHLLAVVLGATGRVDRSVDPLRRAVELAPDETDYRFNLGIALEQLGERDGALDAFRAVLERDRAHPGALHRLAAIEGDRDRTGGDKHARLDEAVAAYRRILIDNPDDVRALCGLGSVLEQQGRLGAAEGILRRALALDPLLPPARNVLGVIMRLTSRHDEAIGHFEQVLLMQPDNFGAMQNIGLTLADMGRFDEAMAWYERALATAPDQPQIHFNRACANLARGDLGAAWPEFEWGFAAGQRIPDRQLERPRWSGEDVRDKTVLVWREQGIGDELLTASCFQEVIERAGHVIIEASGRLVDLFARSFPQATVREERIDRDACATVDYDVQVPFYGLPGLLRPTLDAFPRERAGYLVPDAAATARWRERIDALGPGLAVGMAWRSRNTFGDRAAYYTKLEKWGPLFAVPGVHWILLQYDDCEREVVEAEDRFGVTIHRWPDIDLMIDLDGVAALTSALDLAITPATSVGHMCGALGIETWQTDLTHNSTTLGCTDRYPWMPSVRPYLRDWDEPWDGVIERLAADLSARVEAHAR